MIQAREKRKRSFGGRSQGAKNYSQAEKDKMLDIVSEVLPLGDLDWQQVAEKHNRLFPATARDADSLKRKFTELAKKKPPTGDPNCPQDVKRAKQLFRNIEKRADMVCYSQLDAAVDYSDDEYCTSESESDVQPPKRQSTQSRTSPAPQGPTEQRDKSGSGDHECLLITIAALLTL